MHLMERYAKVMAEASDYRRLVDIARKNVATLDKAIEEQQRLSLHGRANMTEAIVREHVRSAKAVNKERQDLISNCQWYMQLANMYHTEATALAAGATYYGGE